MEQGRTAGDIFILQLQAGDLVAAAIINALERVTLNVDDRAAGLGFEARSDSDHTSACRNQPGAFGRIS